LPVGVQMRQATVGVVNKTVASIVFAVDVVSLVADWRAQLLCAHAVAAFRPSLHRRLFADAHVVRVLSNTRLQPATDRRSYVDLISLERLHGCRRMASSRSGELPVEWRQRHPRIEDSRRAAWRRPVLGSLFVSPPLPPDGQASPGPGRA